MKIHASPATRPATDKPQACQLKPSPRILVVDDNDDLRRLNAGALLHSGYEVDVAADGAAAWEAINTHEYDLVITDNSMPKISGIELIRKVHAAGMTLPVIMASGSLPWEEFARSLWLQPAATLLKPFSLDLLLNTVREILLSTGQKGDPAATDPVRPGQPDEMVIQA